MLYDLDRDKTEEPSVAEMTSKALDILQKNDDGFFLMVEGGRIDHATHDNFPATTIQETIAFDKAIKEALDFAEKVNPSKLTANSFFVSSIRVVIDF
ncbi:hypothetical protein CAI16_12160 [Virgibacillus dokdonensis]|uniref:Alkaline phosphatase n=1 Tax=Virgibacillus dokdonensis TaxID=302167 RepID=A0A3E0WMP0_9BACI|nr:alkaline phosphatase [Virgibacillus dokdonensis]RFA34234.1 hypothetical protein CAI16_12160 [Virgibacillus dokdonensis]